MCVQKLLCTIRKELLIKDEPTMDLLAAHLACKGFGHWIRAIIIHGLIRNYPVVANVKK